MVAIAQRADGLVEPVGDNRGRERGGTRRDGVLVDLTAQPPVQVSSLAGELESIAGADEVSFGLGFVLPSDHHTPVLQRLHPGVEIENVWTGKTLRRLCVRRCRDAFLRR